MLAELGCEGASASGIARALGLARQTVFSRLVRLRAAGLVTSDPGEYKTFRRVPELREVVR